MAKKINNSISAIIIAKNEAKLIEECLKSLDFVSEIILIDTGSTDETVKIAKSFKAKVSNFEGGGFSEWRNEGLKKASSDWVFYIDCDERVGEELKKEIIEITSTKKPEFGCYAIPRLNVIFGKEFRHGGWYPDYVKRLYPKSSLTSWSGDLHEEPVYKGEIYHLKSDLIHLKHETLFEMLEKTNTWSDIEAKLMYDSGHPDMNVIRFLTAMGREFYLRMIKKTAFLDGFEGIIMAMYQVYSRFISYAKLWEMQINKKK